VKFYIATGFARVREHNFVRDALHALGHRITYDWTLTIDQKGPDIAYAEIWGVRNAEFVAVLLPGKYGTHAELGAALARDIKVFITGPREVCVFYEHPLVTIVNDNYSSEGNESLTAFVQHIHDWTKDCLRDALSHD
jgi:hypothetical protein